MLSHPFYTFNYVAIVSFFYVITYLTNCWIWTSSSFKSLKKSCVRLGSEVNKMEHQYLLIFKYDIVYMYSCILDDKPARGKMICNSANKFASRICIDSSYCKTKRSTAQHILYLICQVHRKMQMRCRCNFFRLHNLSICKQVA